MDIAPIVLFVYNRPWHTKQTIEFLKKNNLAVDSNLYIYSDLYRTEADKEKVNEVRDYIKKIDGFKSVTIIEREKNWGLANSIIDGVTTLINQYGKIIVLEDDLVTTSYFLQYMNDALTRYELESDVISIHGYIYPVVGHLPETFFIKGADCWGWATWKRGWDLFEPDGQNLLLELEQLGLEREFNFNNSFDYIKMLKNQISGKNDSWAIRWYASAFLKNKLTLYPGKSLVKNIGNDSSGTHSETSDAFDVSLTNIKITEFEQTIEESLFAKQLISNYFRKTSKYIFIKRVLNFILSK